MLLCNCCPLSPSKKIVQSHRVELPIIFNLIHLFAAALVKGKFINPFDNKFPSVRVINRFTNHLELTIGPTVSVRWWGANRVQGHQAHQIQWGEGMA